MAFGRTGAPARQCVEFPASLPKANRIRHQARECVSVSAVCPGGAACVAMGRKPEFQGKGALTLSTESMLPTRFRKPDLTST